jgi:type II secretory pathway pseudopilin PulG
MNGRGKSAIGRGRADERGTALIVALLVMVIMTLLGIPFLMMGETENRIAENERLSLQALYAAESGARVVKRWFNRPGNPDNLINPPLAAIDREQRGIDEDGDPGTASVDADGSPEHPYYKQVDDAVFRKPFRGSQVDALMGTEEGPDMRVDAADSTDAENFLRDLSDRLLGGYPSVDSGRRARISRIDIYGPPHVQVGGTWKRHGVGTVKVVAEVFQEYPDESEVVLAKRTVKIVLSELKASVPQLAAVNACDAVLWEGDLTVHWGPMVVSVSDPALEPDLADPVTELDKLPVSLPRVVPTSAQIDLLWGYDDSDNWNGYYLNTLEWDGYEIQDPWMSFLSSTAIKDVDPMADQQPWPFPDWTPPNDLESGQIPYQPYPGSWDPDPVASDWVGTHSNYIQKLDDIGVTLECPVFDYTEWKEIAQSGGENVHYFTWAGNRDWFYENGEGPTRLRDLMDGRTGLFFFDTADGNPPAPDGSNLTPSVNVHGGIWGVKGLVYLNTQVFRTVGATGRPTVFRPPGEPFHDTDQNGQWDPGELWVNLDYPDQLDEPFYALNEVAPGARVHDSRGRAIYDNAVVEGILYTNGAFDSRSTGNYYGSVIAIGGIIEDTLTTDTPDIYWDAGLLTDWPPAEWGLDTVAISRWETDL